LALLPSLPDTSVADSPAARPLPDGLSAPTSLPHTAATAGLGASGTWFLVGALLLGLGLVIQLSPRRRRSIALPRRSAAAKRRTPDSDDILAELLDRDIS
jgi:hypothetical protein